MPTDVSPSTLPSAPFRWERELPAEPASVAVVRRGVSDFARAHGAAEDAVSDIMLAVSEAATNAVLHAFVGREPGRLRVIAEPADERLLVRVLDDGSGMAPRSDSPGMGVGLPTMGQLTVSCDIREGIDGRGTEVRMVFAAPGIRGPASLVADDDWRFALLADVGRLAGLAWPGQGVQRLVELLVPRVADACTVDLADGDSPRRIAARVADDDGELSAWLARRLPRGDQVEAALAGLRDGEVRVLDIDEAALGALAHDDEDAGRMASLGLEHWVIVPLRDGDQLVGALGLGLRAGRPDPRDGLAFFSALGERAALSLANRSLIDELDVTHRRLERILGALGEAVTVQATDGRMVYANAAAATLLGAESVDEVLRATPGELAGRFIITRDDGTPVRLEDLPSYRLMAGLDAPPLLTRSVHRDTGVARWLRTTATLLDDEGGLAVNIIADVTETKEAERRQRFLAGAGELLAETVDYERTLELVAGLAVPVLADWCAVDILEPGGALNRLALAHVDPAKVELGKRMQREHPPDLDAPTGLGAVLRSGRPELYAEIPDELLAATVTDEAHLQQLREIGMRSVMILPMRAGEETIGALSFVSAESRRVYGEDDLAFAGDLARRAALAVRTARLFRERGR